MDRIYDQLSGGNNNNSEWLKRTRRRWVSSNVVYCLTTASPAGHEALHRGWNKISICFDTVKWSEGKLRLYPYSKLTMSSRNKNKQEFLLIFFFVSVPTCLPNSSNHTERKTQTMQQARNYFPLAVI